MTSVTPKRALTGQEVGIIFDSVQKSLRPPPHLNFHVIPIDAKGGKISPPQLKFEDGIYLICDVDKPTFPERLRAYILKEPLPRSDYSWCPTGPKVAPSPEGVARFRDFRVRYCYAMKHQEGKQRNDVSGYLWTKFNDGKEDLQYRLLHVFPTPTTNRGPKGPSKKTKSKDSSENPVEKTHSRETTIPKPSQPVQCTVERTAVSPENATETTTTKHSESSPLSPRSHLTEPDVRAVFDCLENGGKKAPPHLQFKIVSVSPKGVSPPRVHFEDGLYALCECVPEHLREHIGEPPRPSSTIWRASGPNKWQSFKIRYCYPQERTHRKKRHGKSGFLWTKVVNGKENFQYRLFLVASSPNLPETAATGCLVCGKDEDHGMLLRCNGCDVEYCHADCAGVSGPADEGWCCETCLSPKTPAPASKTKKRPSGGTTKRVDQQKKKSRSTAGVATVTPGMPQHSRAGRPIARPKRFDDHPDPVGSGSGAQAMSPATEVHFTLVKYEKDVEGDGIQNLDNRLGFVMVESRAATFAVVRTVIEDEVDPGDNWKFVVPSLGPVSRKQEESLGSVVDFLGRRLSGQLGDGSPHSPFRLTLSFAAS